MSAARARRKAPAARTRRRADASTGADARFIVLTGLSGAGKSQAIRALEDLGYFCVDNLPSSLIPTLAQLARREGSDLRRVAIVADVREGSFLSDFPVVYRRLRRMEGVSPSLVFLEASHAALVRRFSETRRPHPLAPDRPVVEGIRAERARLGAIRRMADVIIDTTAMNVHELRERFMTFAQERSERNPLVVTLLSFGFKHGLPVDADLVFDVRFLPNPHFVPALRPRTGRDRSVVRFLERHALTGELRTRLEDLLTFLVPQYVAEGKSYLTVAIGCTGGRHRSVMLAEALRPSVEALRGVQVRVRHRDIDHEHA